MRASLFFVPNGLLSVAVVAFPVILVVGFLFLSQQKTGIHWGIPWVVYVAGGGLTFFTSAFLYFLEGLQPGRTHPEAQALHHRPDHGVHVAGPRVPVRPPRPFPLHAGGGALRRLRDLAPLRAPVRHFPVGIKGCRLFVEKADPLPSLAICLELVLGLFHLSGLPAAGIPVPRPCGGGEGGPIPHALDGRFCRLQFMALRGDAPSQYVRVEA